jgi:hypothetical protein
MERRQFLAMPATLAAGSLLAADAPAPWHQRIRRVGQVNFNERDPVELDVKAWADYWASLKVNVVLVSVTGIVAFYPTRVPNFRRSAFLGDRDLFGDCCRAATERGIRVIARMSPDLQWKEFLSVHPEWYRRDPQGEPVESTDAPGLFYTCPFTSYFTQQVPAIMREVNARYEVSGIFTNAWPNPGRPAACSCQQCRRLPPPGTREFLDAHLERTLELWRLYDAIAKEKKPDNIFFGNLGGGINAVPSLQRLAEVCHWFNCDNQGRGAGGNAPAWGCAMQGRVTQSVMKGRTTTNVTAAWSTTTPRYRNVTKSTAEIDTWLAQTVASGMVPWYHWLGGQAGLGEDRRWQEPGRAFFQWLAKHESHFYNRRSIADLGVVLSQRTHSFYRPPTGGQSRFVTTESMQGLYYALLEGRYLFDFVHEDDLGSESLAKYRALLLPNIALLSDEQCRQLRAYVERGGSLLATFETGLYDERGNPRSDFGLGDVFGIQRAGDRQPPMGNASMARIERRHEILRGFANTNWIAGAEFWLPVKAAGDPVLTVVPAYTAYPPERVYSSTPHTQNPAVVIAEKGRSRLIYFPGDVERTSWQTGHTDLSLLLDNSIRWVLRGQSPVSVTGDGVVELFAWETEPGYAVHVLNYNNPNLHRGWLRKQYPVGAQHVRIDIPAGKRITRVELLRAERTVPFKRQGAAVEFDIPRVDDYEVAALVAA